MHCPSYHFFRNPIKSFFQWHLWLCVFLCLFVFALWKENGLSLGGRHIVHDSLPHALTLRAKGQRSRSQDHRMQFCSLFSADISAIIRCLHLTESSCRLQYNLIMKSRIVFKRKSQWCDALATTAARLYRPTMAHDTGCRAAKSSSTYVVYMLAFAEVWEWKTEVEEEEAAKSVQRDKPLVGFRGHI